MKPFLFSLSMGVLVVTVWRSPAVAAHRTARRHIERHRRRGHTGIARLRRSGRTERYDPGGRLSGSATDELAAKWALNRMQTIGLARPHLESWSLKRGWMRWRASAEIIVPVRRPLTVASMGWVGSTRSGGEEALLLAVDRYTLDRQDSDAELRWKGHILLLRSLGATRDSFGVFPPLASAGTARGRGRCPRANVNRHLDPVETDARRVGRIV